MKINLKYFLLIITLIALLTVKGITAQSVIYQKNNFFNTVMDAKDSYNIYSLADNPACLYMDKSDETLSVETYYSNEHGEFKPFLTPGKSEIYQLSFSGKKAVSENQIFRGTFAVQKDIRNDWDWIATKNYNSGSPFIWGDSTSGKTRYNSLLMGVEYNQRLSDKFSLGASIDYGVDEGLKTVTPRPTSKHRDIYLSAGVAYYLNSDLIMSAMLKTYNYEEQVKYEEDDAAISQETILIKFKGYDYPITVNKTTDRRNSYHDGYKGDFTLQQNTESFKLLCSVNGGFENIKFTDDKLDVLPAGFWKNNFFNAWFHGLLKIDRNIYVGAHYLYNHQDSWAKHPTFAVTIMHEKSTSHLANVGAEYSFTGSLKAGIEAGAKLAKKNTEDYYSAVYWNNESLDLISKISLEYRWSNSINTSAGYAFVNSNKYNDKIISSTNSSYFTLYRYEDIAFEITDYKENSIFIKGEIETSTIGSFNLTFNYGVMKSKEGSYFDGKSTDNMRLILEYRIEAY